MRAVLLALLCAGCWPSAVAPTAELGATVVLLSPVGLPCCSAVATYDGAGKPVLVTAAHCVALRGTPALGDVYAFVTWAQWWRTSSDSTLAWLTSYDALRDVPTLMTKRLPA